MSKLDEIIEWYPDEDLMIADGLDNAIVGIDPYKMLIIYSVEKVLEILVERDEMTPDQAIEFFEFNIAGSYVGPKTPIWLDDLTG